MSSMKALCTYVGIYSLNSFYSKYMNAYAHQLWTLGLLPQVPRPFLWLHGWLLPLPCVNEIVDHEVSPPATPSSGAKSTIKMTVIFSELFQKIHS